MTTVLPIANIILKNTGILAINTLLLKRIKYYKREKRNHKN